MLRLNAIGYLAATMACAVALTGQALLPQWSTLFGWLGIAAVAHWFFMTVDAVVYADTDRTGDRPHVTVATCALWVFPAFIVFGSALAVSAWAKTATMTPLTTLALLREIGGHATWWAVYMFGGIVAGVGVVILNAIRERLMNCSAH